MLEVASQKRNRGYDEVVELYGMEEAKWGNARGQVPRQRLEAHQST